MLQNKKPSYIFTTTGKSISLLRKNFCIRAPRFLPAPRPSFCYLRGFWERKAPFSNAKKFSELPQLLPRSLTTRVRRAPFCIVIQNRYGSPPTLKLPIAIFDQRGEYLVPFRSPP